MLNTKDLLRRQFSLYPGMETADVVKLLYQSEFGGGHLIEDEALFCAALAEETALAGAEGSPPVPQEEIGGGFYRVHLGGLEKGLLPQTLARLCVLSAQTQPGNMEAFVKTLEAVPKLAAECGLPLQADEWRLFVRQYREEGCPPLHYSARFRALYRPHYRVLGGWATRFLQVFALVDRLLLQSPRVFLGIDGMSAAGKSSLAALLQQVYGCALVHTDDFFLRPGQRSSARLQEPGGNIDYERLAPVAALAAGGEGFEYLPYSCQTGEMGPPRRVPAAALTVLEGAYSMHPKVGAAFHGRVFVMAASAVQARRTAQRNGPALAARFADEWIPMENLYHLAFNIREGCDVVVDTSDLD